MATEVGSGYVSLVPSAKGFGPAVAQLIGGPVEQAAGETGAKAGKSLQSSLLGQVQGVGGKLLGALGFAGIGLAAFKSAEDVENAQNIIIRSTGATGKAAEGLEASFKNIAKSSPASFDTIASALSTVYQRTGLTGQGLEGLTRQIVTFNRITKDSPLDVAQLTQALAGFNVPAAEMGKTLDQLFTTSQHTGVPLADLVSTLVTAGPVARQFGFSVSFTAGLLAQLNKAGVDTNSIMPGLRRAFIQFAKDGREPAGALRDVLGQMDALVKKGDELGAQSLAVKLFGARGVGLVDAAVSGKLSLESLSQTFDSTGKGILATASTTGTLSGKLGILKNQAVLAFASFGTPLLKAATGALADAIPIVTQLGDVLTTLQPAIQPGILAFGAFYATSKLLVPVVGFVTKGVESLSLALAGLDAERSFAATSAFAAGLGRLAPALPGLAAGGVLVAASFDQMGKSAGGTAEGIIGTTIAGAALGSVIPGVGTAVGGAAGAAIGAGIAFGKWATQSESLEDKLKSLDQAAKGLHGTGDDLARTFIQKLIPAAADAAPNLRGAATSVFAFRQVAEQSIGTAARLAEQFKGTQLYTAFQITLQRVAGSQRELNQDQQTGSLIAQGYTTDTANLTSALSDLQSVVLAASGGQIGYQQSIINVQKAQTDLNDAIAQYGPDSDQARDAQLNLASAQNQAAGATLSLDQAQSALQAKYKDTSSVDAAIAQLQQQQQEYPATADSLNPLIFQLLTLKAKYDDSKNLEIQANADQALGVIANLLDQLALVRASVEQAFGFQSGTVNLPAGIAAPKHSAAGNLLKAGEPSIVGEEGWELFIPDTPGHVIPHDQSITMAHARPVGSDASGQSLFRDLIVQAPTDDPVRLAYETGRKIDTRRHLMGV